MMIRAALTALWLAALSSPTLACAVHEPLETGDFAFDQVVLRGTMSDYSWDEGQATFTVHVTEVIAGKAPGQITVLWSGPMAETAPPVWDRPPDMILGLTPPQAGAEWALTATICGEAHLMADTVQNRRAISVVLGQRG